VTKRKDKLQAASWFDKVLSKPYLFIFSISALLYVQILSFGLVHFDDHGFVLMAADTLKLSNIPIFFKHSVFWVLGDTTQDSDVFYRPLQNVVYAICNTLAPKQPWIYHLTGILLHSLVACTLYRFFSVLKYSSSVAFLFALLYSVHPVLVQGVAWIAGLGDQLATLFTLLSVIYFIRMLSLDVKKTISTFLHLFFLLCALYSKEVSVMIIPLCLFYFVVRPAQIKERVAISFLNWKQSGLFFVIAGWSLLLLTYFISRNAAIHATKESLLSSALSSFKVNGILFFEYMEKIFLPFRLSPIPSREDAHVMIGIIVFIIFASLFVFLKRVTRMTLFGALWFVVFLLPSFIQQNPLAHFFAFEHRLYLPLIGIVIMMMELINVNEIKKMTTSFQKMALVVILLIFCSLTFLHSRTFNDSYTFYDKAISSSPKSVIAYNGYGKLLLEDKKYVEAIEAFKKSHEYKSDDLETTGKIAEIYLKNLNNPTEAINWFKKTLEIKPNSIEAAVSIGDAYWNFLKDTANAVLWYNNSLLIDPQNEFAMANLGMIYAGKGNNSEARKYLSGSLSANPKNLAALKWMAISYFNEQKIPEAVSYLNKAYEIYPGDVDLHRNLMICYYKLKEREKTEKFSTLLSQSGNAIPAEIEHYLKN